VEQLLNIQRVIPGYKTKKNDRCNQYKAQMHVGYKIAKYPFEPDQLTSLWNHPVCIK
jgi:hypothetical protein